MAAREHRKTRHVTQTEKMIPLITGEIAFRHNVCELFLDVNVFDSDFGFQIDLVKQPI